MLVVFGAAIFLSAGTPNYVQAWVFIAIFAGCGAGITVYLWKYDPQLLERRESAGPAAETRKSQKLMMAFCNVGVMAILVIAGLDHRWNWSHVPTAMSVLGDILTVAGGCFVFLVFRTNSFASATIEIAEDQRVISTGPYSVVRHPMYTGVLVWLIGTPLALGSYWGLPIIVAMMPALAWRIVDEEGFLARRLSGYAEYQKMVRYRLVPFIW